MTDDLALPGPQELEAVLSEILGRPVPPSDSVLLLDAYRHFARWHPEILVEAELDPSATQFRAAWDE